MIGRRPLRCEVGSSSRLYRVGIVVSEEAVAIGAVTQPLLALELGAAGLFAGFLAGSRNGRGLRLHITSVEPAG